MPTKVQSISQPRTAAYASPRHLAAFVHRALGSAKGLGLPCLERLVNAAFSASLRTAEGREVSLDILLRLGAGKWDTKVEGGPLLPFYNPRRLDTDTLVQLAHGLEADRVGVAAESDGGSLALVGLVKLAPALVGDSQFLARLGAIRLTIAAPGHLVFMTDDAIVAELRDGSLLTEQTPVLFQGPVRDRLRSGADRLVDLVRNRGRARHHHRISGLLITSVERARVLALFNLLLNIRSLRYGGSLVIIPEDPDPAVLNVGFSLSYAGIPEALQEIVLASLPSSIARPHGDKKRKSRERAVRLAQQRLDDAVRFVARLSGIDGIIVLDEQFRLVGFGAIATSTDIAIPVSRAEDSQARLLTGFDTSHRGTRHRSIIATCARIPEAVGFVVSQDGHIRTVLGRGDDVVVWDQFSEGLTT